jgi:hypothetical protein
MTAPTPGTRLTATQDPWYVGVDLMPVSEYDAEVARLRAEVTQPHSKRLAKLTAERDEARAKLAEVSTLAEGWRYKGAYGGDPRLEDGPDEEGWVLDGVSAELLKVLDAAADADRPPERQP